MTGKSIRSAEHFEALMSEIDGKLRDADVPISERAIRGLAAVAAHLGRELKGGPLATGPIPGNFQGDSLSAHIFSWFDRRYGDRLKIDLSYGSNVHFLCGDPWLVVIPLAIGDVRLVCDPDLSKEYPRHGVGKPGENYRPAVLNIFKCIKNIPESVLRQMTDRERVEFRDFFISSMRTYRFLAEQSVSNSLAGAARYDLWMAAKTCCSSQPDYGQSRWLSLQGAEKAFKMYISERGGTFPRTHDLSKLSVAAERLGMAQIDDARLARIQCSADVRYGGVSVGLTEAAQAQESAFWIATQVVRKLTISR